MKTLYTARATALGGRKGHTETDDKRVSFDLSTPGAPDSKPNTTNPEQLFASGYAACFGSAVEHVAKQQNIKAEGTQVRAEVSLNQDEAGFSLSVTLSVTIPGVDGAKAEQLIRAAHKVCPYSKAIQGNVDVKLKANDKDLQQAA